MCDVRGPTEKRGAGSRLHEKLIVRGAREHNLKDVPIELPRDALVVFNGLSGSGKAPPARSIIQL